MLPTYRFDNPKTNESVRIGRWSYVWAALFGALYVLIKAGPARLLRAIVVTLLCTFVLIVIVGLTSVLLSPFKQILVVAIATPAVLVIQSRKMMELVRSSYRRGGWQGRREED